MPAALLVSTIFCRSAWRYRNRGYRYALIDAGHLVQNLVTAANGLGIQTTTRLGNVDLKTVVDNTVIDRLVKEGFFEQLLGPGIRAEIDRKSKMAFR